MSQRKQIENGVDKQLGGSPSAGDESAPTLHESALASLSLLVSLVSSSSLAANSGDASHSGACYQMRALLPYLHDFQGFNELPPSDAQSTGQQTYPSHGNTASLAASLGSFLPPSDAIDRLIVSGDGTPYAGVGARTMSLQPPLATDSYSEPFSAQMAYIAGYMTAYQHQNAAASPSIGATSSMTQAFGTPQQNFPWAPAEPASNSLSTSTQTIHLSAAPTQGASANCESSIVPVARPLLDKVVDSHKYSNETFPERLYRMLEEIARGGNDDIISFSSDGKAFEIHRPDAFVDEIIPLYFRHGRFSSFRRQLSMYGFKRLDVSHGERVYAHELFARGHVEQLSGLKRVGDSDVKKAARSMKFLHLVPDAREGGCVTSLVQLTRRSAS